MMVFICMYMYVHEAQCITHLKEAEMRNKLCYRKWQIKDEW